MDIKTNDIKLLREKTGAGMMDCKKALTEANGDLSGAEKLIKEWGLAGVEKRSGRATNEGRVFVYCDGKVAAMAELNCETDFVARNEGFLEAGDKIVAFVKEKRLEEPNSETETMVKDIASVIKENISLKRVAFVSAGSTEFIDSYTHGDGKIGVLVHAVSDKAETFASDKVKAVLHDVSLHVAAFSPLYLDESKIPETYKAEQAEIFRKQMETDEKMKGKPEKVLEGILQGKMKKMSSEVCLLEQGFVKDEKTSVGKMLADVGKEVGATLTIKNFLYFRVGC